MASEWKECTLAELGEIVGGATPSTKDESNYGGDIAWITPKDLSTLRGRFIAHGERNITEKGLNSCSTQMMPTNAVLFSSRAPIGYVAIAKNPVCTNQGFKSIVANADNDPMFLYYLLKYNKDAIEAMGSGTTFKEVSGSTMRGIRVRVPVSKAEQQRIASVLAALDSKIENNDKINDNLLEQLDALYQELSRRDNWDIMAIGDLAEKIAMGPFGSNIKVSTFVPYGVPIISGNHLRGYFLEEPSYNYITEEHAEKLKNSVVYPGDIVFTHAGNIGQVSMIIDGCDYPRYVLSQRQFYLRCNKERILPEYVTLYFHSAEGQHELLSYANQTGVPSIAQPASNLKKITLPVPPIQIQEEWAKLVRPIISLYQRNRLEVRALANLRDALLPKLMSGDVDVSNIDI